MFFSTCSSTSHNSTWKRSNVNVDCRIESLLIRCDPSDSLYQLEMIKTDFEIELSDVEDKVEKSWESELRHLGFWLESTLDRMSLRIL